MATLHGLRATVNKFSAYEKKTSHCEHKRQVYANDIHFFLTSVTLFWAFELPTLTCNVKQLNSSFEILVG